MGTDYRFIKSFVFIFYFFLKLESIIPSSGRLEIASFDAWQALCLVKKVVKSKTLFQLI